LWDLEANDSSPVSVSLPLQRLEKIETAIFSPDQQQLFTKSIDGTVRRWHLQIDYLLELACRSGGRNLTKEEFNEYAGKFGETDYVPTCQKWISGKDL
jgi:WD40 repeat protein